MLGLILTGIIGITTEAIGDILMQYSYLAIFGLMILEAASFPVPSEVVLPAVGYFAASGMINPLLGFAAAILGGVVGMGVDYYVAYFLGKEVVYKHLNLFHIKKRALDAFDRWFANNGAFAVFVSRLIPVVRGLINFPAGFAEMPIRKFYIYSIAGTVIWDVLLIGFGFYALSLSDFNYVALALILFSLVLYFVYHFTMKRIGNKK